MLFLAPFTEAAGSPPLPKWAQALIGYAALAAFLALVAYDAFSGQ